jgi:hypothetical protein
VSLDRFEQLAAIMREDGWPVSSLGPELLETRFEGRHGRWSCYARVDEENGIVAVHSVCPVIIPDEKLPTMVEFVNLVNVDMAVGNMEVDPDSGSLSVRTSVALGESPLAPEMARNLLVLNVVALDRFMPGILTILGSDQNAEDAFNRSEQPQG